MIDQGLLVEDPSLGDGVYVVGTEGWQQGFDWVSLTPYMWNNSTGQFITYDDPVSLSYKREFSHDAGLQGIMLWEVQFDTPNASATDSGFSRITSQSNLSRSIQMALRVVW